MQACAGPLRVAQSRTFCLPNEKCALLFAPFADGNGVLTPHCAFDAITVPFGERFMYAVVETGSKQYRVAPGDTIKVELLDAEAGKEVTLDQVLFVANDGKFSVGAPTVDKASVVADVVEHTRGEKVVAFKMRRRKGYHRTVGHRQELTVLKIKEIKA
jgi:large subunit ribosomal protein L21